MAFNKQQLVSPVRIGDIKVVLFDPDPTPGDTPFTKTQKAVAEIQVPMSDGTVKVYRENIADHFNATTLNQLKTFVASVRTKANSEILG